MPVCSPKLKLSSSPSSLEGGTLTTQDEVMGRPAQAVPAGKSGKKVFTTVEASESA